jgi:flagellar hook-associated protein 2
MQADGTRATKASKLGSAITTRSQLQKLLATSGADTASSGFMVRFSRLADAVLGVDGSLTMASSTMQDQISKMVTHEDDMQRRLDATQARLTAQYQALDAQMANLNSLSNYVTAQLAAWNKPSN